MLWNTWTKKTHQVTEFVQWSGRITISNEKPMVYWKMNIIKSEELKVKFSVIKKIWFKKISMLYNLHPFLLLEKVIAKNLITYWDKELASFKRSFISLRNWTSFRRLDPFCSKRIWLKEMNIEIKTNELKSIC